MCDNMICETTEIARRSLLIALSLAPAAWLVGVRDASAAANAVSIRAVGGVREIRSNAIPAHATGAFPNRGNPHSIEPQELLRRVTLSPRETGESRFAAGYEFGIAVNGVPFEPLTAEFWNRDRRSGWRYEASTGKTNLGLDSNNAHVQPNGLYHYHGLPRGLIARLPRNGHSPLIGWAADGFPIYAVYGYADPRDPGRGVAPMRSSWRLKSGARPGGPGGRHDGTFVEDFEYVPGLGDLDRNNGRRTVTPDYPAGTYAYFLTEAFPAAPHYFAGTPDDSFKKRGGGPGGAPGGRRGPPPDGRPPPRHGEGRPPRGY